MHELLAAFDLTNSGNVRQGLTNRSFGKLSQVMDYKRAAEWIYTNLFSESSPMRLEKFLIRMGKREVDGPNEHEIYKFKLPEAAASGHR